MTDVDTWVFGYGSLVSPSSLATTIGRVVEPADVAVAELTGFGRRWNYGAAGVRGSWADGENTVDDGVMVALGLVPADEACNGVAVRVTDHLARYRRTPAPDVPVVTMTLRRD